MKLKKTMTL